ncbi:peptidase S8/S53 domain-containing protein [Stachybotrys elegans]|uniref:Peptidase S8/S53 domain-containing protein n=1 Tax=Stachybotrys elegans TaxID=80388 RepID=A0A8K0SQA5_9HYPO|nr:peptidase S8/S53 domain-containing protein [Stachybotrys elegans]
MIRFTLALSLLARAFAEPLFVSNQIPGAYIIELEQGQSVDQFRIQEPYETRLNLDFKLFKGVSIQLNVEGRISDVERAAQLASLPAVKNVWPVRVIDRPEPVSTDDERPNRDNRTETLHREGGYPPHVMTGVDKLHAEGITGKGVTIAVLDGGIDYHHPALGGCFGEGCLVAYGYDLVGDDYDLINTYPDEDPDDTCDGHGTHIAGIIAAQGDNPQGFRGVAPDVTLAAYRVFGCRRNGVGTDILIAAFNMAYEQGANIISASIGEANGWPDDPLAVAVSRIVEQGVPCMLAAGNRGNQGLFYPSSAAEGDGVTAVASFDNPLILEFWNEAFYSIDGESAAFPWATSYPGEFDGVEREVWASSDSTRDACDPLPDNTPNLTDYLVLFRESQECDVVNQAINLAAKGARFLLRYSYNERMSMFDVSFYEGTENILAAASTNNAIGETLLGAIKSGSTVKAMINHFLNSGSFPLGRWNTINPGSVSSYTSWGPTFEMDFKPQFGAPGGNIYSTYPLELGGWRLISGTSMATPFAAGAYALVSQARGIKQPKLLEILFASTAKAQLWSWDSPFKEWLAPGAQQGSGLIQVYDAAFTTAYLEPSSLSFNDTANSGTLEFVIVNNATEDITFYVSHVPSRTLYTVGEDEITVYDGLNGGLSEFLPQTAELSFSLTSVTVGPGSAATIQVTASAPKGLNEKRYPYWSGFITVNSTANALTLPYQGLSGFLNKTTMLSGAFISEFPDVNQPVPANHTFVLPAPGEINRQGENPTIPILSWVNEWGTRYSSAYLAPASLCSLHSTYKAPGGVEVIGELELGLPRELLSRARHMNSWTGKLSDQLFAPAGRYRIVWVAQRLYSDGSRDEDWEIKYSQPFHIRYLPPRPPIEEDT